MVVEETKRDLSGRLPTFQGVQGVVQLLGVAVDALQSAFGDGFGAVHSVQQLVGFLRRETRQISKI